MVEKAKQQLRLKLINRSCILAYHIGDKRHTFGIALIKRLDILKARNDYIKLLLIGQVRCILGVDSKITTVGRTTDSVYLPCFICAGKIGTRLRDTATRQHSQSR